MPRFTNLPHKPDVQLAADTIVHTLDDRGQSYLVEDGILTLPCPHELAGMCRLRRRCVWTLRWSQHDARLVFEHTHASRCGYRSDDLAAVAGIDVETLSFPALRPPQCGAHADDYAELEGVFAAERAKAERDVDIVALHKDVEALKRDAVFRRG